MHIAQVNVTVAVAALDDPVMAPFVARLGALDALAREAPGFVARPRPGEVARADVVAFGDPDRTVVNWSVWASPARLRAFTYGREHLAAMRELRHLFLPAAGPQLALWWVPVGQAVTPGMAYERLSRIRADGPGPAAFTFDAPY
jgi:hypothetical protein